MVKFLFQDRETFIDSLLVVIDRLFECRKIILEEVKLILEFVQAIFEEGNERRRFLIWEEYFTSQRAVRRRLDERKWDEIRNKNFVNKNYLFQWP